MGIYKLDLKKGIHNINSLEDWEKFAPPKKTEIQWKDGRSAKELAKYIVQAEGYIPKEIEEILLTIGCNQDIIFCGEPEVVTRLTGKGEGRNHDLLLIQDNEFVVGIEAKADEPLGKLISKELSSKDISENKINRINSLYKDIYGSCLCDNLDVRYQLLTATVGTLIEAEKFKASKALLIIITFKKDKCYELRKINSNIQDINTFINSLCNSIKNEKYNLPGYLDINFYIKHIEIDV